MCIDSSDVIALAAIFIAIITPAIQAIYGRRREWHEACEILFKSIDSLCEDILSLANNPNEINQVSYQLFINQRKNLLMHYKKRFLFQRKRIQKAFDMIQFIAEIPGLVDNEELLNKGYTDKEKQKDSYLHFMKAIRNCSTKATEALIS